MLGPERVWTPGTIVVTSNQGPCDCCGGVETTCCPDDPLPNSIPVRVVAPDCASLDGLLFNLVRESLLTYRWSGSVETGCPGCNSLSFAIECIGGVFVPSFNLGTVPPLPSGVSPCEINVGIDECDPDEWDFVSCNPLEFHYTKYYKQIDTGNDPTCCSGPEGGCFAVTVETIPAGGMMMARAMGQSGRQSLPCINLGKQLSAFDRPRCQRIYQCDIGFGDVCPDRQSSKQLGAGLGCLGCPGYVADSPTE